MASMPRRMVPVSSTNTRAADDISYIRKRMEEIKAEREAAQQPKVVTPVTPHAPDPEEWYEMAYPF